MTDSEDLVIEVVRGLTNSGLVQKRSWTRLGGRYEKSKA